MGGAYEAKVTVQPPAGLYPGAAAPWRTARPSPSSAAGAPARIPAGPREAKVTVAGPRAGPSPQRPPAQLQSCS